MDLQSTAQFCPGFFEAKRNTAERVPFFHWKFRYDNRYEYNSCSYTSYKWILASIFPGFVLLHVRITTNIYIVMSFPSNSINIAVQWQ